LPTEPALSSEPAVHGTIVLGFLRAAERMWGSIGQKQIAERLSPEARAALLDQLLTPFTWLPERLVIEGWEAVYDGPLKRDGAALDAFVDRSIDEGWGRVQRALIAVMTPGVLARRAPELWAKEHSTGVLEAKLLENEAVATLRDHPYVATSLMRRVNTESFRYLVSLSRVGVVKASHGLTASGASNDRALVMRLSWR
jgi:hypothetical protein